MSHPAYFIVLLLITLGSFFALAGVIAQAVGDWMAGHGKDRGS